MDRLPCELLQYILRYIDQPLDLFRMSCVCSRWRSFIMNEEYFLNQWFSRLLKHSRESYSFGFVSYSGDYYQLSKLNVDQSLLPINLRSSKYEFLPWIVLRTSSGSADSYEHVYYLSLYDSSHSFSFWLFLPSHYELNIKIGNCRVKGLNILLGSDEKYHFDNGESVSIANRWIHVVLTKINSQSNYRICVNGQYITKFCQCQISLNGLDQYYSLFNFLLSRKFVKKPLKLSTQAHIADLNAFKRCLTLVEIRAIHQQQASIEQVKVGTYINSN